MIEWIVANSWVTWLVVFLILAIIEMMTLDLFFIMMSSGALVALFAALLGLPFWLQVVIFCVVALLMVLFVRPVALRHLHRGPRDLATNVDRLIGDVGDCARIRHRPLRRGQDRRRHVDRQDLRTVRPFRQASVFRWPGSRALPPS